MDQIRIAAPFFYLLTPRSDSFSVIVKECQIYLNGEKSEVFVGSIFGRYCHRCAVNYWYIFIISFITFKIDQVSKYLTWLCCPELKNLHYCIIIDQCPLFLLICLDPQTWYFFTSELQINAVYRIVDLCARVLVNAHRIGRDFDWIAFSTWVKLLKSGNSICASIDLCKRFEPFWPPLFCKGNYVWFYFCNEYYLNSDLLLKYL